MYCIKLKKSIGDYESIHNLSLTDIAQSSDNVTCHPKKKFKFRYLDTFTVIKWLTPSFKRDLRATCYLMPPPICIISRIIIIIVIFVMCANATVCIVHICDINLQTV